MCVGVVVRNRGDRGNVCSKETMTGDHFEIMATVLRRNDVHNGHVTLNKKEVVDKNQS